MIAPDFVDRYLESCHHAAPLIEFVTKALGLAWIGGSGRPTRAID